MKLPGHPLVSTQFFSTISPAVWPAIRNIYIYIYTNVLLYYIDLFKNKKSVKFTVLLGTDWNFEARLGKEYINI